MYKIAFIALLVTVSSCRHNPGSGSGQQTEPQQHEDSNLQYTLFSEHYEFHIEHELLEVGRETEVLVHMTDLSSYKPCHSGRVTVRMDGVTARADRPARPGIFRIPFVPENEGSFDAEFLYSSDSLDESARQHIDVYKDHEDARAAASESEEQTHQEGAAGEIEYLKEQAWNADFMVTKTQPGPFRAVIPTSGEIAAMPGEKKNITASGPGIVRYNDPFLVQGSPVHKGQLLFTITSESLIEDNVKLRYEEAKNRFEKSRSEYNRHQVLFEQQTISERQFQSTKSSYVEDSLRFYSLASNISEEGIRIIAAVSGTIHELNVSDGEYTEPGRILAILSTNQTLMLRADLPQQYYTQLKEISSAHFRPAYSGQTFTIEEFNGSLLAAGVSVAENDHYLPVIFRLENNGELLEGAFAEVFLLTGTRENVLSVPVTALGEQQGGHYVYLQVTGESYSRRSVRIGANNGLHVEIKSGLEAGDRVVTRGVMLVKAASISSGAIQDGHSH
jgi:RND family efflux transporter MFP subunit